ncbi:hypothetical protein [Aeromonas phage ZPAH34]|uniref:hypothetical protein n=1 Tax=Aeromonas phage ZPAH34 TaxID=2924888 RepID=UPI0023292CD2|nr:hypothetical protein PQD16_gp084 [Aeromonas phage ZPAH34]UOX39599.1 hypothetical protein [Aeromonas phage ZPAH34]
MIESNVIDDKLSEFPYGVEPELAVIKESDIDHVVDILDGYSGVLSKEQLDFAAMSGTEAYGMTVLKLHGFQGSESWVDTLKSSGEAAYKAIIETLRKIKEFFFGDGKKVAEEADKKAVESLEALSKLDMNAPIKEETKLTNPLSYFKGLGESVELENLMKKYPTLETAIENCKAATSRIANAKTVGQLGAVYTEMRKKASDASKAVTTALEQAVKEAETAAEKMRKGPSVSDDVTNEIQQAAKAEQKETVDTAKEETKNTKLLGSIRTKITGMLNAISNNANSVKPETKESEFKG